MGDRIALALEEAERSSPPVRAAALMRIARVEAALDPEAGRRTFDRGLREVRRLPGHESKPLLSQAGLLAAAVAPDFINDLPAPDHGPQGFWAERLGRVMLDHGHGDAAFDYVMRYGEPSTFPFSVVSGLMEWYGDEERRLALLRRAIEVWRNAREDRFLWLFQTHWKALPGEEAQAVVREIVGVALARHDQPVTARYGQEGTVEITSQRENTLFQVLHVLRHLDSALAEQLIGTHEQLAAAAQRFPKGIDSLAEEVEASRKDRPVESYGGGFFMGGSPRDFPYMRALLQASRDGDFGPPIEFALEQYHEDSASDNPNQVPQEFWPSTCSFRSILYRAGVRLGDAAAVYLERIPDRDLRLFAQIELAAALAGLPELQGTQMQHRRRPGSYLRRK